MNHYGKAVIGTTHIKHCAIGSMLRMLVEGIPTELFKSVHLCGEINMGHELDGSGED